MDGIAWTDEQWARNQEILKAAGEQLRKERDMQITLVEIDYTNWKGVRSRRRIIPIGLQYGSNEFHKESQWLLQAYDTLKGESRTFAMAGIHSWNPGKLV